MKSALIPFLKVCGSISGSRGAATRFLYKFGLPAVLSLVAWPVVCAHAQVGGEWVWMGGGTAFPIVPVTYTGWGSGHYEAVYGVKGVTAPGNTPGSRQEGATWVDHSGNVWMFGGYTDVNDMWEFNPTTGEWTWVDGPDRYGPSFAGVYGQLGVPAAGNIPGGRTGEVTWTDHAGNFWLYGGIGVDSKGNGGGYLNDLWEFNPSTKEWAWVYGSSTFPGVPLVGEPVVYGTLGASTGNSPGARQYSSGWIDSSGDLWLFGGIGIDPRAGMTRIMDDLWKYNPTTKRWTWVNGSGYYQGLGSEIGNYIKLGVPGPHNIPGARFLANSWIDQEGNLWIFGGEGYDSGRGLFENLNDMWEFNPRTGEWTCIIPTWEKADYGDLGVPSVENYPGPRIDAASWTDAAGNFWLLGGAGFGVGSTPGELNDLWAFSPTALEWAWMGGSQRATTPNCSPENAPCYLRAVFGTLYDPSPKNEPGGISDTQHWTDSSGNVWFYGGYGTDSNGEPGWPNDFWELLPAERNSAAAMPSVSVAGGSYLQGQSVTLSAASKGATIYYTLDGTWPNSASAKYAKPVWIAKNTPVAATTLTAMAVAPGLANSAFTSATYTILGSAQTINFPQPGPFVYGQKPTRIPATSSSGLPVTITNFVGAAVSVTDNVMTILAAGGAMLAANQPGNATYAAAPQVLQDFTISPAVLTVTAVNTSMTYASAVPKLPYTLTGFVNGDALGQGVFGAPFLEANYGVTNPPLAVGSYTITPSLGTLEAFYYSFKFVPGTLAVKKATLAVTANNLTMKQGAAVPALTYGMSGFVNGDVQGKVTTGAPKLTTTATLKSAAGKYPITVAAGTLAAGNYGFSYVNGTLTVTK